MFEQKTHEWTCCVRGTLQKVKNPWVLSFNPIQDGGRGGGGGEQKSPPINFSPVISRNLGVSPQKFLTFSFYPFIELEPIAPL